MQEVYEKYKFIKYTKSDILGRGHDLGKNKCKSLK